jgi:cytochrome c biogenesis protein CcmG/thiol:disulfide interchange protein DsbE
MNKFLLPLGIFIVLVALLAVGLNLNPREVPSPLIGKPAPDFSVPRLHAADQSFSPKEMQGKVWLFNVWASWCVSCREEHPLLVEFGKTGTIPIVGLNYKDKREDGQRWLARFGDPYLLSAYDADGRVGINYGVYGVPETYLIDKQGVIRFKQIGPITPEVLRNKIIPLAQELNK